MPSQKIAKEVLVALRKESVDRNCEGVSLLRKITMSLSARRAWIEIPFLSALAVLAGVALRKESVDRNVVPAGCWLPDHSSLSARRAWIEILFCVGFSSAAKGRSPQGERG